jgi:uncharacterized protein YuzE
MVGLYGGKFNPLMGPLTRRPCPGKELAMNITYDRRTDTLSIVLASREVAESDEDKAGVILDYDAEGRVVGIEILEASKTMPGPRQRQPEGDHLTAPRLRSRGQRWVPGFTKASRAAWYQPGQP